LIFAALRLGIEKRKQSKSVGLDNHCPYEGSTMLNTFIRMTAIAALASVVTVCPAVTAKLCLDAGHGGSDPGAISCPGDNYEKTNTLNTILKFRDWLNADSSDGAGGGSWTTVLCRSTDVFVSLQGRCNISNNNGCNRFLCIHNNAFNCSASGTETFTMVGAGATTDDLRNKVQNRMIQAWNRINRGNKEYNFYVLVNTAAPAELAELAFVDQAADNVYCRTASHQDNAAKHHLYAIQNHYGITAYTPGTGGGLPTVTLDNNQAGFAASANWSTGTSAADKFGADYRFRSTAAISDRASWSINVGTAGTYRVQGWWSAGTNRAPSADYTLPNGAVAIANQQASGGQWNTLGTMSLATGARVTYLSCWEATGFVVIADAIRITP
jgi:N-acetylmuramoyl-L-alanine amidase